MCDAVFCFLVLPLGVSRCSLPFLFIIPSLQAAGIIRHFNFLFSHQMALLRCPPFFLLDFSARYLSCWFSPFLSQELFLAHLVFLICHQMSLLLFVTTSLLPDFSTFAFFISFSCSPCILIRKFVFESLSTLYCNIACTPTILFNCFFSHQMSLLLLPPILTQTLLHIWFAFRNVVFLTARFLPSG